MFERYASSDRNGGNVAGAPGYVDLEQVDRRVQVTEPVLSEIDQTDPIAHLLADHTGAHDLPAVRDGHHPRRPVHLGPEPVPLAGRRLTRVQAHPDPQLQPIRPCRRGQRALCRDGRGDSRTRDGKHRVEPVTRRLHDMTAVRHDRVTDQLVVKRESVAHRFRVVLPQTRGSLDIREQEGDGLRQTRPLPVRGRPPVNQAGRRLSPDARGRVRQAPVASSDPVVASCVARSARADGPRAKYTASST